MDFSYKNVKVLNNSEQPTEGKVAFREWNQKERKKRALKKTGKIVGAIFGVSLIGLFVHILLIVIIPILVLTLIGAVPLYLKYHSEEATFYFVEAQCPSCQNQNKLKPYVNSKLQDKFTIQCPKCGETSQASLSS